MSTSPKTSVDSAIKEYMRLKCEAEGIGLLPEGYVIPMADCKIEVKELGIHTPLPLPFPEIGDKVSIILGDNEIQGVITMVYPDGRYVCEFPG